MVNLNLFQRRQGTESGPLPSLNPPSVRSAQLPAAAEAAVAPPGADEDWYLLDLNEESSQCESPDLRAAADRAQASPILQLIEAARAPHPLQRPFRFVGWCVQSLFGIASLILALSVVAAIPIVNFIALGYLLEVEGRVARSGRFREAFPLIHLAPRIGAIVLGIWLWLLPLRFLSGAAADARLIAPGAGADRGLHVLLFVSSVLLVVHLCLALARGGRFTTFFRPIKNVRWMLAQHRAGGYWDRAERGIQDFITGLRLKYHFWLGLRGFVGGFAWLVIPTLFFAAARETDGPAIVVSIFGGILLTIVLSWVPFLQARFAAENRLGAMREFHTIRKLYQRAPLCWLLAVVVTYSLALPLYLSTVALPPQDAMWVVTVIFIMSIYPARVLVGWAYHQAVMREKKAAFYWRWLAAWLMMPTLGFFVFLLFFTQFIGQNGKLVLFEHHALLLPVPF